MTVIKKKKKKKVAYEFCFLNGHVQCHDLFRHGEIQLSRALLKSAVVERCNCLVSCSVVKHVRHDCLQTALVKSGTLVFT